MERLDRLLPAVLGAALGVVGLLLVALVGSGTLARIPPAEDRLLERAAVDALDRVHAAALELAVDWHPRPADALSLEPLLQALDEALDALPPDRAQASTLERQLYESRVRAWAEHAVAHRSSPARSTAADAERLLEDLRTTRARVAQAVVSDVPDRPALAGPARAGLLVLLALAALGAGGAALAVVAAEPRRYQEALGRLHRAVGPAEFSPGDTSGAPAAVAELASRLVDFAERRERAVRSARERSALLEATFARHPSATFVLDADRVLKLLTPSGRRLLNDLTGQDVDMGDPLPAIVPALAPVLRQVGEPRDVEVALDAQRRVLASLRPLDPTLTGGASLLLVLGEPAIGGGGTTAGRLRTLEVAALQLRDPLTTLGSQVRLLLHTTLDERQRLLAGAGVELRALAVAVQELVDAVQLEARTLAADARPGVLRAIVEGAVADVLPRARRDDIELVYDLGALDGTQVLFDPDRAAQVVTSLLWDSVKVTLPGRRVVVVASIHDGKACVGIEDGWTSPLGAAEWARVRSSGEAGVHPRANGLAGVRLRVADALQTAQGGELRVRTGAAGGTLVQLLYPLRLGEGATPSQPRGQP